MTMIFYRYNSNTDLDHGRSTLKRKLVRGIVIIKTFLKMVTVTLTLSTIPWNATSFEVLPYRTLVCSFMDIRWEIKSRERWQRFFFKFVTVTLTLSGERRCEGIIKCNSRSVNYRIPFFMNYNFMLIYSVFQLHLNVERMKEESFTSIPMRC